VIYQLALDTFIGSRAENQDSILNLKIAEDIYLVGIADGMGGMTGGKMASTMTVEAINDYIQSLSLDQFEPENLKNILNSCYEIANFCISKAIEREPKYRGMGTTLALLLISGDVYVWSNVGDSRIYMIREGSIDQITVDHTYIQHHFKSVDEEVPDHMKQKYDHLLTKCVDGSGELPDIFPLDKFCEDIPNEVNFLLCSDGLILNKSETDDDRLKSLVADNHTVQDAVSDLISYAYSSGSKDNISVGVVKVREFGETVKKKGLTTFVDNFLTLNNLLLTAALVVILSTAGVLMYGSIKSAEGGQRVEKPKAISPFQRKVVQGWTPLDLSDFRFPVLSGSDIHWSPYPDRNAINYYHVMIVAEDEVLVEKYLRKTKSYISIESLGLEEGKVYTMLVDAITLENKRLSGNSVVFSYKDQSNQEIISQ
jgi:serine/threonine protein phosphatase PrpC